jgi:hypothetical protein
MSYQLPILRVGILLAVAAEDEDAAGEDGYS